MQLSHFFTATKTCPSYETIGIAVYRENFLFRNQARYVKSSVYYVFIMLFKERPIFDNASSNIVTYKNYRIFRTKRRIIRRSVKNRMLAVFFSYISTLDYNAR